jgi:hypothetical protein
MKDLRPAIRTILLGDPAVAAAVSSGNSPDLYRIYPGVLPQGITLPSLVQNLITEGIGYHMQGDDGLMISRVQIDAWALTQDLAVNLANLVFDRLSGYSGTVTYGTNSPQQTMVVRGVFHDSGRDDYDDTSKMFARRRDYFFWFAEE